MNNPLITIIITTLTIPIVYLYPTEIFNIVFFALFFTGLLKLADYIIFLLEKKQINKGKNNHNERKIPTKKTEKVP